MQWLLSEVNSEIKSETDDLKKFLKMAKFQRHDFVAGNDFSKIEQILSNMNPHKRQLQIFNQFFM